MSLTRLKISDRETGATFAGRSGWMANTQSTHIALSRGSLHRQVRSFAGWRMSTSLCSLPCEVVMAIAQVEEATVKSPDNSCVPFSGDGVDHR